MQVLARYPVLESAWAGVCQAEKAVAAAKASHSSQQAAVSVTPHERQCRVNPETYVSKS